MGAIKGIAMDVDGVLTDGGVWWGPNGEEWKRFHFADIMGLSLAQEVGNGHRSDLGRETVHWLIGSLRRWESLTFIKAVKTRRAQCAPSLKVVGCNLKKFVLLVTM